MILKSELRQALTEPLEEELPEATEKERATIVEAQLDRLCVDFDVHDDEDDEPEDEEETEVVGLDETEG